MGCTCSGGIGKDWDLRNAEEMRCTRDAISAGVGSCRAVNEDLRMLWWMTSFVVEYCEMEEVLQVQGEMVESRGEGDPRRG